jgi:hypothetical protein
MASGSYHAIQELEIIRDCCNLPGEDLEANANSRDRKSEVRSEGDGGAHLFKGWYLVPVSLPKDGFELTASEGAGDSLQLLHIGLTLAIDSFQRVRD